MAQNTSTQHFPKNVKPAGKAVHALSPAGMGAEVGGQQKPAVGLSCRAQLGGALGRQVDLYEFEANLVYKLSSRLARTSHRETLSYEKQINHLTT